MLRTLIVVTATLVAGSAFADEIIIHRDSPPPPPSSTTTIERHESVDGCSSRTVHKEDAYGDSKTVTRSDC